MRSPSNRHHARRGLTMIEMMVTVALLLLIMSIIVTIFQQASGAVSVARENQELDEALRRLDRMIRQDLKGITAKFNPFPRPGRPFANPADGLDPDDNLGYFEYSENALADLQGEDVDDFIAFTAKAPEGTPFLGRVWVPTIGGNPNLNIPNNVSAPGLQPMLVTSQYAEIIYFVRAGNLYRRVLLVAPERQKSVTYGFPTVVGNHASGNYGGFLAPMFNGIPVSWQGMNDLSARPAGFTFGAANNYPILNTLGDLTNRENRFARPRFANDYTGPQNVPDGIPDDTNFDGLNDYTQTLFPNAFSDSGMVNEQTPANRNVLTLDALAFPFVFRNAYSQADKTTLAYGWIHTLDPSTNPYTQSAIQNQNPLPAGDSLPAPGQFQTWWGFPTWRETMSTNWADPFWQINFNGGQQSPGLSWMNPTYLPPVTAQPFSDGAGSPYFFIGPQSPVNAYQTTNPLAVWEDDLIMTGVRSFDVKAYDPNAGIAGQLYGLPYFAGYYDLGYLQINPSNSNMPANAAAANILLQSFAHEGRIPPLTFDLRTNPKWVAYSYNNGFGDNNNGTIRLRRVYDTWSTDYSDAADTPLSPLFSPSYGFPPVYPSFPKPYPVGLRGIQIQIRINDPRSERVRMMTIRQDFSDKQ